MVYTVVNVAPSGNGSLTWAVNSADVEQTDSAVIIDFDGANSFATARQSRSRAPSTSRIRPRAKQLRSTDRRPGSLSPAPRYRRLKT